MHINSAQKIIPQIQQAQRKKTHSVWGQGFESTFALSASKYRMTVLFGLTAGLFSEIKNHIHQEIEPFLPQCLIFCTCGIFL